MALQREATLTCMQDAHQCLCRPSRSVCTLCGHVQEQDSHMEIGLVLEHPHPVVGGGGDGTVQWRTVLPPMFTCIILRLCSKSFT